MEWDGLYPLERICMPLFEKYGKIVLIEFVYCKCYRFGLAECSKCRSSFNRGILFRYEIPRFKSRTALMFFACRYFVAIAGIKDPIYGHEKYKTKFYPSAFMGHHDSRKTRYAKVNGTDVKWKMF